MRKIIRAEEPQCLREKSIEWGDGYARNRALNSGFLFQWPQYGNLKVNQIILPVLISMSPEHCHYCDGFPLGEADHTIDHFKPKHNPSHYHLVCNWGNLYLACADCQRTKDTQFDDLLLRPDEGSYQFLEYFIYDPGSNEILPNPKNRGDIKFSQAEKTIEIFGLNSRRGIKQARKFAIKAHRGQKPTESPNDLSFRFLFE